MNARQRRVQKRKKRRDFIQWLLESRKEVDAGLKDAFSAIGEAFQMLERRITGIS